VCRRAQQGAQLLAEHARLGQAPADRAQTERRVQLVLVAQLATDMRSSGLSAPMSTVRIVTGSPPSA
jgi:hypothetical protein